MLNNNPNYKYIGGYPVKPYQGGNTFFNSIGNAFKKAYDGMSYLGTSSSIQQTNPSTFKQTLLSNTQNDLPDWAVGQSRYTPRVSNSQTLLPNATGLDGNPTYISRSEPVSATTNPTFTSSMPTSNDNSVFSKGSWIDKSDWASNNAPQWNAILNDPNATPYQKAVAQEMINKGYEQANSGLFTDMNGDFSFKNTMGTIGSAMQLGQAAAGIFDSYTKYKAMKDNLKTAELQREVMRENLNMTRQEYARLQNQRKNYTSAYMGGR